jgi:two-component system LytT family response regulator
METRRLVRAYIVDDDRSAMALLRKYLEDYSVEIVGTASDIGTETTDSLIEQEPDLLFLDVELPSGLGLDFWATIRPLAKSDMKVVFYTGYDKYLLEALRREAFDYLLKPANKQELAKIMTRYYENKLGNIQPVINRSNTMLPPSVMIVNAINEHTVLRFQDIAFFRFQSERRLWEVITTDERTEPLRRRTTADTILAYSADFVQVHKRYIVNVNHVQRVLDTQIVLSPPMSHITELHVSKNFRHSFLDTFYNM